MRDPIVVAQVGFASDRFHIHCPTVFPVGRLGEFQRGDIAGRVFQEAVWVDRGGQRLAVDRENVVAGCGFDAWFGQR